MEPLVELKLRLGPTPGEIAEGYLGRAGSNCKDFPLTFTGRFSFTLVSPCCRQRRDFTPFEQDALAAWELELLGTQDMGKGEWSCSSCGEALKPVKHAIWDMQFPKITTRANEDAQIDRLEDLCSHFLSALESRLAALELWEQLQVLAEKTAFDGRGLARNKLQELGFSAEELKDVMKL